MVFAVAEDFASSPASQSDTPLPVRWQSQSGFSYLRPTPTLFWGAPATSGPEGVREAALEVASVLLKDPSSRGQ